VKLSVEYNEALFRKVALWYLRKHMWFWAILIFVVRGIMAFPIIFPSSGCCNFMFWRTEFFVGYALLLIFIGLVRIYWQTMGNCRRI